MSAATGIAINIAICLILGGLLTIVRQIPLQVILFVALPFVSAYLLYWGGVLASGGNPSGENANWAGLFIGTWGVPGYLGLGAGLMIARGARKSGRFTVNK